MILSHVHADHIDGVLGLVGRISIGMVWHAFAPHETPSSREALAALSAHEVRVETPQVGETLALGNLKLEVLGPTRRYGSANDQSIVVLVTGPRRSMLLTGDIEQVAQRALIGVTADVLQVPHHGAGTSDPKWLAGLEADLAVISVGADNRRGHPVDWVIEVLEGMGTEVRRTDVEGDLVIPLD